MNQLFTRQFFKFVAGFLSIIIATLLIVAGVQMISSNERQTAVPTTSTTTSQ